MRSIMRSSILVMVMNPIDRTLNSKRLRHSREPCDRARCMTQCHSNNARSIYTSAMLVIASPWTCAVFQCNVRYTLCDNGFCHLPLCHPGWHVACTRDASTTWSCGPVVSCLHDIKHHPKLVKRKSPSPELPLIY